MILMPETGNPNVYTIFKGKYALTLEDGVSSTNNVLMLTMVDVVQFLGDYTTGASGVVGTVPEECRPVAETYVPCYDATTGAVSFVRVMKDGTVMGNPTSELKLRGCNYNISGNHYR